MPSRLLIFFFIGCSGFTIKSSDTAALEEAGVLQVVEEGQPSLDAAVRVYEERVRLEGPPPDEEAALVETHIEMLSEYIAANRKAYGLLVNKRTSHDRGRCAPTGAEATHQRQAQPHHQLAACVRMVGVPLRREERKQLYATRFSLGSSPEDLCACTPPGTPNEIQTTEVRR